jgi:hypothetical protein
VYLAKSTPESWRREGKKLEIGFKKKIFSQFLDAQK